MFVRRCLVLISIFAMLYLFPSCGSNNVASSPDGLLKNWDTVNATLSSYRGNSFDEVVRDFGQNYSQGENTCVFYSPTEESSITFFVKGEKVKGFFYGGSYSDMQKFIEKNPKFKNSELQVAANSWLGFSPDLLKETFGSLVLSSSDKRICVGPSESSCIEFVIGSYSPANSQNASSSPKVYIKKANVKGSYDELKNYLVNVPEGSVHVKKTRQKNF